MFLSIAVQLYHSPTTNIRSELQTSTQNLPIQFTEVTQIGEFKRNLFVVWTLNCMHVIIITTLLKMTGWEPPTSFCVQQVRSINLQSAYSTKVNNKFSLKTPEKISGIKEIKKDEHWLQRTSIFSNFRQRKGTWLFPTFQLPLILQTWEHSYWWLTYR